MGHGNIKNRIKLESCVPPPRASAPILASLKYTGPPGSIRLSARRPPSAEVGDQVGSDVGVRLQPVRENISLRARTGHPIGGTERSVVASIPRKQGAACVRAGGQG